MQSYHVARRKGTRIVVNILNDFCSDGPDKNVLFMMTETSVLNQLQNHMPSLQRKVF